MKKYEALRLLSIETNRIILSRLDEPKTAAEVFEDVKSYVSVKNREAVYKALERLKEAGIVNKEYKDEKKKILYSKKFGKIEICLKSMEINFI